MLSSPLDKDSIIDVCRNSYHSTLAIRPKLIELIGKYSQRKGTSTLVTCVDLANTSQMISHSLTRGSSSLAGTMRICWMRQ